MSGNPNRSARKGVRVEKEKIENLRVQVANMLEYVRIEVKAAEDQYNFSPDKGVARYMRALGRLEGIQQVNKIIVQLFGDNSWAVKKGAFRLGSQAGQMSLKSGRRKGSL